MFLPTPLLLALLPWLSAEPVNGLHFEAHAQRERLDCEDTDLHLSLRNATESELRVKLRRFPRGCTVTLFRDGRAPVRRSLAESHYVRARPQAVVEPRGSVLGTVGSLESIFGELEPGRYSLRVDLEADAYFTNAPGYRPARVSTPVVEFVVRDSSFENAVAANAPTEDVALRVDRVDGVRMARLTNRRPVAIRFPSYGHVTEENTHGSLLRFGRWDGEGWEERSGLYCGTGIVHNVVDPGADVVLSLPNVRRSGILRLELRYRYYDGTEVVGALALSPTLLGPVE